MLGLLITGRRYLFTCLRLIDANLEGGGVRGFRLLDTRVRQASAQRVSRVYKCKFKARVQNTACCVEVVFETELLILQIGQSALTRQRRDVSVLSVNT